MRDLDTYQIPPHGPPAPQVFTPYSLSRMRAATIIDYITLVTVVL